jgi:Uma2 family endonuclease
MSAVLEAPRALGVPAPADQRLVLRANWSVYEKFLAARGEDFPGLRINYDRGRLELVTISSPHDQFKYLLGRIIDTVTEELGLAVVGQGQTTIRRQDLDRGFEPDEWYYVQNAARMQGIRELNFDADPPPDLAVEIEITRSLTDRIGLYAAVGVPEVWRFDGAEIHILHLQSDGRYAEYTHSRAIPALAAADVNRVLAGAATLDTTTLFRNFRQWVRQYLLSPPGQDASAGP